MKLLSALNLRFACTLLISAIASPVLADLSQFELDVQAVAKAVANQLGGQSLRVEPFRDLSIGKLSGKSAEGLRQTLITFLQQAGVHLGESDERMFILSASFAIRDQAAPATTNLYELTLQPTLEDSTGKPYLIPPIHGDVNVGDVASGAPMKIHTDDTSVIAKYAGFSGPISPDAGKEQRHEDLRANLQTSPVVLAGTKIKPSAHSPYAVEVLVFETKLDSHGEWCPVGDGRPAHPTLEAGRPYVEIPLDAVYELVVYNDEPHKAAAVQCSIDGVNVFHFCEQRISAADVTTYEMPAAKNNVGLPAFNHYLVFGKGQTDPYGEASDGAVRIPGWFLRVSPPNNVLSFLVKPSGQGAVSKLGFQAHGEVGAIHLQFAHANLLKAGSRARGGKETATGPPKNVEMKAVRAEAERPHEFLTIRYSR